MTYATFDDFLKIEFKIGKILSAERVEGSAKLLKLSVDFGEEAPRQVISGIAKQFVTATLLAPLVPLAAPVSESATIAEPASELTPNESIEGLIGNSFVFTTNLEPRNIMGLESQAMIIAGTSENGLALMKPTIDLPPGTKLS